MMNMDCPQCNSKVQVTRVSTMYYDCQTSSRGSDYLPSDWQTWRRYHLTSRDAKTRKALAKRLAPPTKPGNSNSAGSVVGVAVEGGIAADSGIVGMIIGGLLAIILLPAVLLFSNDASAAYSEERWTAAMDKWDAMLYCAQCDVVFMPEQGKFVSSKQIGKLLYRLRLEN